MTLKEVRSHPLPAFASDVVPETFAACGDTGALSMSGKSGNRFSEKDAR